MDKRPINEGAIRSNIKVPVRDGVQKGLIKPTEMVKPPPPPPPTQKK